MTFTATFVLIFLLAFVLIGGFVLYLSRTIEHGEARFDSSGREIRDEPKQEGAARPAQRLEDTDPPNQVNNDE